MNKLKMYVFILSILISLSSCNTDIKNVYEHKNELLKEFKSKDIIKRGDVYYFVLRSDSTKYEYFFKNIEGEYTLIKDSISNRNINVENLNEEFRNLIDKMKAYEITSFTSEFEKFGITLKIFLQKKEILYVKDIDNVKNREWLNFIKNANKIDENWYWRKI